MSIESLNVEEMNEEEISKLFKVFKTLNKMMEDRGYIISKIDSINKEDWLKDIKKSKSMNGFFTKLDKNDSSKKIRLYYHYIPSPKLNMEMIKNFLEIMHKYKANSGIIIMSGKISQQARQKIQEINNELQVEVFTLNDLVVNITEYELVPKHILLSQKEKQLLLDRYKIKESQLPKILVTDPVARYLGLKRGDVVKIIRVSETAGRYITYRIAC
jgi:DNA-directed RNA polymerase I, II, and III subunit RPABC1